MNTSPGEPRLRVWPRNTQRCPCFASNEKKSRSRGAAKRPSIAPGKVTVVLDSGASFGSCSSWSGVSVANSVTHDEPCPES